jgi:hypothetical protein
MVWQIGLGKKISAKTKCEKKEILKRRIVFSVMNVNFANASVNYNFN